VDKGRSPVERAAATLLRDLRKRCVEPERRGEIGKERLQFPRRCPALEPKRVQGNFQQILRRGSIRTR
jgi:hypothetical protein